MIQTLALAVPDATQALGPVLAAVPIDRLSTSSWSLLVIAALMIGFAKTAVNGAGALAVVVFASVVPARESTAAILPLLLAGDALALLVYRRHAQWPDLARLFPAVVPGMCMGAVLLAFTDDTVISRTIGLLVLTIVVGHVLLQEPRLSGRHQRDFIAQPRAQHWGVTLLTGCLAGFTTMTANAGGPVMTVYLIRRGLAVKEMLGTVTWFFAVLNLAKVPVGAGLGLFSTSGLLLNVALLPALIAGAMVGVIVVRRIDQRTFERAALALAAVSAVLLLV